MLTAPTAASLATFSGRTEASFGTFGAQALTQAALLFTIVTGLSDYPDDADQSALATNGILQMALYIFDSQPYAAVSASPFSSETIGSYSYSKASAIAAKAKQGLPTGLFWWDTAVAELTVETAGAVDYGAVSGLNRDSIYEADDGSRYLLGPAELDATDYGYDINTELNPRPVLG